MAVSQNAAAIVEFSEAQAWMDLFRALPTQLVCAWKARAEMIGGAVALLSQEDHRNTYCRVIGLGLVEPATPAMFRQLLQLYDEASIRSFAVQLSPFAEPFELRQWLCDAGLRPSGGEIKFLRSVDAASLARTDLRVEQITGEHAADFARIAGEVLGLSSLLRMGQATVVGRLAWRHYLAFCDERPVATAAMFVHQGIAWLGMDNTLPDYRGRGAQSALLARRIEDARIMGCRRITIETTENTLENPNPSYRNIVRAGFQPVYFRPIYILSVTD